MSDHGKDECVFDGFTKIRGPVTYHRLRYKRCNVFMFGDNHTAVDESVCKRGCDGDTSCGHLAEVLALATAHSKKTGRQLDVFCEFPANFTRKSNRYWHFPSGSNLFDSIGEEASKHMYQGQFKKRWGDRVRYHYFDFHGRLERPKGGGAPEYAKMDRGVPFQGEPRDAVAAKLRSIMFRRPPAGETAFDLVKPYKQYSKLPRPLKPLVWAYMEEYIQHKVLDRRANDPYETLLDMYALARMLRYMERSDGDVVVVAGACHCLVYIHFMTKYMHIRPTISQYAMDRVIVGEKNTCVGSAAPKTWSTVPRQLFDPRDENYCVWHDKHKQKRPGARRA